ncbi:hypothetical protein E5161_02400 [Cohnella pontilimi]|uniref:Nucleotide-diphospho-sugar transferase domain-containing protein n=1 Tax=Cohnella pontilimi TaxID=2564100 RepID=A0A4U0FH59_9BACL|nr:hypothetical protein [Cohnella pontilimi]TJY44258.1 hypothetical protein E5161_02400 [Cohnella pontilimi]
MTVCFAILAHEKEDVLANQVDNLTKFVPGCKIVLYNSSPDPDFGKNLNLIVYPDSRPLEYGKFGMFFLEIMSWLKKIGLSYDYLVNLDSDIMYIRSGYEYYLDFLMQGYEAMGIGMGTIRSPEEHSGWYPVQTMWKELRSWQPYFQTDYFGFALNSNQVYRKDLVDKMVEMMNIPVLKKLIEATEVFALEEILWPTLAMKCGAKTRPYLQESILDVVRIGAPLSLHEAQDALTRPQVYFIHPVRRDMLDPVRQWISSIPATTGGQE